MNTFYLLYHTYYYYSHYRVILIIMTYKGVIQIDIFISLISGPIFIGIVLIYSLCITVYFIHKKNKLSSNNVEGIFTIKTSTPLVFTSIFIWFLALTNFFLSKHLISLLYFLLPAISLYFLIRKSRKLLLRKESIEANTLRCSYKSIQHINLEPHSNINKYNLKITINNKTHTIIIQAKDKDRIKEILDSKQ